MADSDHQPLLSQSVRRGPWNLCGSLLEVVKMTSCQTHIRLVLAGAEFGSERNHTFTRQRLRAQSAIPAKRGKKTSRVRGLGAEIRRTFPCRIYGRRL